MTIRSAYPPPSRPVAMGVNGMVSAGNPLASMAGVQVLADGGNAFDAAVAVAVTLGVVEPYMSGVGGVGVAMVHLAGESQPRVLNFFGRAPGLADPSMYTEESKDLGILAPLVPGNVAGWLALHESYGSLDRQRLFQPAIDYAENGFPITYQNSATIAEFADRLRPFPTSAPIFLDGAGQAPPPGTRLGMPQLAASLRKIADRGAEVFYSGELAHRIVEASRQMGGILTLDDLAGYQPEWQDPIGIDYRGYRVYAAAPPSCGFQELATLKLMERFDPSELVFQSADTVHTLIEATKLCATDRIACAGDPDHVDMPLEGLLSAAYASRQRERIDMRNASLVPGEHYERPRPAGALSPGRPEGFGGGNTTHLEVADRDGNVVGVTQTLGHFFGSGVAAGDTGILLNNMSHSFDLDEESPNRIGPGKRVASGMAPTQTYRDGRLVVSLGMPGGWAILQRTPQILVNFLDFGMNVQQAIEAPQFRQYSDRDVHVEERLPVQVRRELEARGHLVTVLEQWSMRVSGAQAIQIDEEQGVYLSGCDTRRDGYAIGL